MAYLAYSLYIKRMQKKAPSLADAGSSLQLMDTFVRIVEAGSLSAAAAQMNATQPTISRRLQGLEKTLGVRLLQRSTHGMRLTVDGERCYERAKDLLASWAAFEADLRGTQHEPQGKLRIAVPHAFGQEKFVEPLSRYLAEHPRVSVEWLLMDNVADYIASGIDCALKVGEPIDPSLVAIKLSEVPRFVVAAPSVLGKKRPANPADLAALPWLSLKTYYRNEVLLTHSKTGEEARFPIRPRVSTDSLYALRSAALLGIGVCIGSAWLLADDIAEGKLVHLTPQWQAAPLPVYITYPHAQFYPSRLQRFIALMREAVPQAIRC